MKKKKKNLKFWLEKQKVFLKSMEFKKKLKKFIKKKITLKMLNVSNAKSNQVMLQVFFFYFFFLFFFFFFFKKKKKKKKFFFLLLNAFWKILFLKDNWFWQFSIVPSLFFLQKKIFFNFFFFFFFLKKKNFF